MTRVGELPDNFEISDSFGLGTGTDKTKIDGNLAAIHLPRGLDRENRYATRHE